MRRMLDALYPNLIPLSVVLPGDLIAAYVGHDDNPQSAAQALARFPGHQIVTIASHNAVDAQVLDVERGAVDPGDYATMNAWCSRQNARGVKPTIYCNTSTWPTVTPHLIQPVNWWAARWGADMTLPPGASLLQYGSVIGADTSVLLDHIDGIDSTNHNPSGGGQPIPPAPEEPVSTSPLPTIIQQISNPNIMLLRWPDGKIEGGALGPTITNLIGLGALTLPADDSYMELCLEAATNGPTSTPLPRT